MFRKLLVPLDRSPLAEQAVGQAAAIARASHAGIDFVLVHQPFPFVGFGDAPWNEGQENDEHTYLETIVEELASGASVPATHAVMRGEAVEMICRRAADVEADLIVMTSHGRTGLSRAWLGSIADGVLRRSAIPVLMLRPVENKKGRAAAHHGFARVLVPLDGSALALEAVSSAAALARSTGARLVLLRVVQPVPVILIDAGMPFVYPPPIPDDIATARLVDEAKQQVADVARTLADQGIAGVETHVIVDELVAHAIIAFARAHEVDLIAMSTHGRGMSRVVLGSVADKVLRGSGLPLLLRRPVMDGQDAGFVGAERVAAQSPALSSV
jgi:nucleotide-binding universal stress UspA family protein